MTYLCRVTKHRSTWQYFLENHLGGGGGSSASSKRAALYAMLRCIKPGETFRIIVNGDSGPMHTRVDQTAADPFVTYANEMVYITDLCKTDVTG